MKINVHAGHNPAGKIACGAVGILDESVENRKVKEYLITYLKNQGHTVYDCTCDNGTGQTDVLRKIVAKCNAHSVDVDISLHLNSGGGHGTECLIYGTGGNAEKYAKKIQSAIVKRTGYADRGIKVRSDLYVLKNTTAPAVLVECCFVDSSADAKMWDAKAMAAAICEGLMGQNPLANSSKSKTITTTTDVTVRSAAGSTYGKVGTLEKGTALTVAEETPNWAKVAVWVPKKYTTSAGSGKIKTMQAVNARAEKGTDNAVIGTISKNVTRTAVEETGNWVKIYVWLPKKYAK